MQSSSQKCLSNDFCNNLIFRSWASEGFFPGGALAEFSRDSHKDFSRGGAKSGEISFFLLKTKKTTFLVLLKMQQKNFKFQNSKGALGPPALLSDAHAFSAFAQTAIISNTFGLLLLNTETESYHHFCNCKMNSLTSSLIQWYHLLS